MDLGPYLNVCGALLGLLPLLLGLSYCLALLASDEASRFGDYNWESDFEYLFSFHSLVVCKVAVLLVAVVKVVTGLEDVDSKVASTSDAVIKVANALEVVRLVA